MSLQQHKPDEAEAEVQRILALKRHEQPPPAFFQGFSEKVIDRIQTAGPGPRPTLRQRLSLEFYGVPIYICAAGVIVCGLLVAGLIGSLRVGPAQRPPEAKMTDPLAGQEPSHSLVPPQPPAPPLLKDTATTTAPGVAPGVAPTPSGPLSPPGPTRATLAVPDAPAK